MRWRMDSDSDEPVFEEEGDGGTDDEDDGFNEEDDDDDDDDFGSGLIGFGVGGADFCATVASVR